MNEIYSFFEIRLYLGKNTLKLNEYIFVHFSNFDYI